MLVPFIVGAGWNYITKGDNWKFLVGFGLSAAVGVKGRAQIWRGTVWASPYIWSGTKWIARRAAAGAVVVASDAAIMGRAFTTTQTGAAMGGVVTIGAAIGVGYTVGAVTTTIAVGKAEEKGLLYEGAQADILDFYTPGVGDAHYWDQADRPTPGYFNIPGNVKFIWQSYFPGGN